MSTTCPFCSALIAHPESATEARCPRCCGNVTLGGICLPPDTNGGNPMRLPVTEPFGAFGVVPDNRTTIRGAVQPWPNGRPPVQG